MRPVYIYIYYDFMEIWRGPEHTPVDDLVLVTPVDGFDELVDIAADLIGRRAIGQLLEEL